MPAECFSFEGDLRYVGDALKPTIDARHVTDNRLRRKKRQRRVSETDINFDGIDFFSNDFNVDSGNGTGSGANNDRIGVAE